MKKVLITLMVAAMIVMAAGVVSANPDEPVNDEVDAGTDLVEGEEVVAEEPVTGEKQGEAEEDYVRPDEEGEVGITSEDGMVDEALLYATGIGAPSNSNKQSWYYIGAGVLCLLFSAALFLRRKASKS